MSLSEERQAELTRLAYRIAERAIEDAADDWMGLEEQLVDFDCSLDPEYDPDAVSDYDRNEELGFLRGELLDMTELVEGD